MKSYTFEAVIGKDSNGDDIKQSFTVEAQNFAEARHKLEQLVRDAQLNIE